MKKFSILMLFLSVSLFGFCGPKSLQAFFSYTTFYAPGQGSYIETYLSVQGGSLIWVKNDAGKFQGSVQVTLYFKQNDEIKDFRKFDLLSPELADTTNTNVSFLDQRRILLPNGVYDFELEIGDKNDTRAPFVVSEAFNLNYGSDSLQISGIEFVESLSRSEKDNPLTKSGFDIVPYLDNFFPAEKNKLTYYAEIYNAPKTFQSGETFTVTTAIEPVDGSGPFESYLKTKKETPRVVNVQIGEFDISKLPSGNYNLVIRVKNQQNEEIAQQIAFFQRSNPSTHQYAIASDEDFDLQGSFVRDYTNIDTLREYLHMITPIATASERMTIQSVMQSGNVTVMQRMLHNFWVTRNATQPDVAWKQYYRNVLAVNAEFSTARKKGYDTDRGRVYLQYGPPNARMGETIEPATYPYEIWHYYKAGSQTDRRFVFCTRDITVNDYQLIHSTVKGEIYDPSWQYVIIRGNRPVDANDDPKALLDSYFGAKSSDYYNTPR